MGNVRRITSSVFILLKTMYLEFYKVKFNHPRDNRVFTYQIKEEFWLKNKNIK